MSRCYEYIVNKKLQDFGIEDPLQGRGKINMGIDMKNMKKVEAPDIVKLSVVGDQVQGTFRGIEESVKFPDSYAVRYNDEEGNFKVTFVSRIGRDLIISCNLKNDMAFVLKLSDKKKTDDGKNEYNIYELFIE